MFDSGSSWEYKSKLDILPETFSFQHILIKSNIGEYNPPPSPFWRQWDQQTWFLDNSKVVFFIFNELWNVLRHLNGLRPAGYWSKRVLFELQNTGYKGSKTLINMINMINAVCVLIATNDFFTMELSFCHKLIF